MYAFLVLFISCSKDRVYRRDDSAVKITNDFSKSAQNPVFSPDGKYLVYTRFLNGYNRGPSELVKLRIDSLTEEILVRSDDADNVNVPFGSWVQDKVCFSSDRGGGTDEIWEVNDDGTGLKQLTYHSEESEIYYIEPVYNPKNITQIVFEYVTGEDDNTSTHQIAYLDKNTGSITLLTNGDFDDRLPSWSNDGKKILFQRNDYSKDEGWMIYVADINTDGQAKLCNIHTISNGISDDTDCSWSFDDKYVLTSSNADNIQFPNIFMMPVDTTLKKIRKTYSTYNEDGAPSQSHDGKWIAFESHVGEDEDYPSEIWIIKVD